MPDYKLTYFNLKGLGESIRYIFAYANVPFEDNRLAKADWPALKETTPYGKLPILEFDGKILDQSLAIARFVGKSVGMATDDLYLEAKLESIIDNVRDIQPKLREEFIKKTPEAKQEADETIAFVFERIEKGMTDEYLSGAEPTWVDVYFAGFADTLTDYKPTAFDAFPKITAMIEKIRSHENIKKYIEGRPVPEPHN